MRRIFAVLLLILPAFTAFAATPPQEFDQAVELYLKAVDGDTDANKRANKVFERLLKQEPTNPLYMVYTGITWVLKGKYGWQPWNKFGDTDRGLNMMAKAMTLLQPEHDRMVYSGMPVSVTVRGLTATAFTQVPGVFKRFDQGREIFTALMSDPLLDSADGTAKAYIHYYAAEAAREDKDIPLAKQQYQSVLAIAPGSQYESLSKTALAELN